MADQMAERKPVLSAHLADETATLDFAKKLLPYLAGTPLVFLEGQLGAGKTTLVRGLLRSLGHTGSVKSPTYTLLEPYEVAGRNIYHFDLYRIGDSEELDFIGIDELLDADALKLIEWAEKGAARLPAPDVTIRLSLEGEGRHVEVSVNS